MSQYFTKYVNKTIVNNIVDYDSMFQLINVLYLDIYIVIYKYITKYTISPYILYFVYVFRGCPFALIVFVNQKKKTMPKYIRIVFIIFISSMVHI